MKKQIVFCLFALITAISLIVGVSADADVTTTTAIPNITTAPDDITTAPMTPILPDPDPTTPTVAENPASDTPALSPALSILAADAGMAKAGLAGEKLVFSHDDFCRALNLGAVSSITVKSLPDAAAGNLLLGTTVVTKGQKISRQSLGMLVFAPATDAKVFAEFSFTAGDRDYPITCSVFMLDSLNASPVTLADTGVKGALETFVNTVGYGKLTGYDQDGDALTFEIVKRPSKGIVIMTDRSTGEYVYLPEGNFRGTDSFEYIVRDCFGNYSASSKVEITVSRQSDNVVYSDMTGNRASTAALLLNEKGIMPGFGDGNGKYTFAPDEKVSRVDFLVMLMKASGVSDLPDSATVFADDSDIPAAYRPYVSAAYSLGYIGGDKGPDGSLLYSPNAKLTTGEAALLVSKFIDVKKLAGPAMPYDISDGKTATAALGAVGVLNTAKTSYNDTLTRADAALMLETVLKYK